jgi:hypothetical protein
MTRRGDPRWKTEFACELASLERLNWSGTLDGRLRIDFERRPAREHLLSVARLPLDQRDAVQPLTLGTTMVSSTATDSAGGHAHAPAPA